MACGCGGSNPGAASGANPKPLLSGFLSSGAVDDSTAGAAPADTGIAAAGLGGSPEAQFRVGGFWFLLAVFVIGAAWYLDSQKKGES